MDPFLYRTTGTPEKIGLIFRAAEKGKEIRKNIQIAEDNSSHKKSKKEQSPLPRFLINLLKGRLKKERKKAGKKGVR